MPNTSPSSQLVKLVSVSPNSDGTVTVEFDGPVSQFNVGDSSSTSPQGAGITVTDPAGDPLPTIDSIPTVSGLGTSTLTLSFTGSGAVGGGLPTGTYAVNLVGNGLIGNGRAVDVDMDMVALDSFASEPITVDNTGTVDGDFDNDGDYDCDDINMLTAETAAGTNGSAFDLTGDGSVDTDDITAWLAEAGAANLASGNSYAVGDANLDGFVDGLDFIIGMPTNSPITPNGVLETSMVTRWSTASTSFNGTPISLPSRARSLWVEQAMKLSRRLTSLWRLRKLHAWQQHPFARRLLNSR